MNRLEPASAVKTEGSVRISHKPVKLTVYLLSGGTGRTAEAVVKAAAAQFGESEFRFVNRPRVRSKSRAMEIVKKASPHRSIVCHSLVDPDVRSVVVCELERRGIPSVDVLGPTIAAVGDVLKRSPEGRPGLSYELNKEQFDRIDAVDYTLAHDDGLRLNELNKADVVLVGVSRVAKSVACFCLAFHGVRAANVPIIPGLPPPFELLALDPRKVVGLTMNPLRLQAVRSVRASRLSRVALVDYSDLQTVTSELDYARRMMRENRWRFIDVSYMAVEEIAHEVMRLLGSPGVLRPRATRAGR